MTFWQENYSFIKEVYDTRYRMPEYGVFLHIIRYFQVLQDGGVDGQCGDGHRQGVRQQGLHLRRVQEGER